MGPYSLTQVNEYLADGSLMASDPAWHEGLDDWCQLDAVQGVTDPWASPPPPPNESPTDFPPANHDGTLGAEQEVPEPDTPPPSAESPTDLSVTSLGGDDLHLDWTRSVEHAGAGGPVCHQCNAPLSLGEPVCIWCGAQIYADAHGGKPGGIGKIIGVICSLVFVLALVGIGIFFLIEKGELLTGKPEWRDPQSLPNTVIELEELAGKGDANAQYKLALVLLEMMAIEDRQPAEEFPQLGEAAGWILIARDNGHKLGGKEVAYYLGIAWTGYEVKNRESQKKKLLEKYPKAAN